MKHKALLLLFFLISLTWLISCVSNQEATSSHLLGGEASINDASQNAFGLQANNLTEEQSLFFFVGNSLFNKNWVTAPASTTARDGLGPIFNARSCSGCHFKDGRGRAPRFAGDLPEGMLIRLSVTGNTKNNSPKPHPVYGGQLQDLSIPKVKYEGTFSVTYTEIEGQYPDGTPYSLRKPTYTLNDLQYGDMGNVLMSPRVAPQMIGLGLLEAILPRDILAHSDPEDSNDDGISGKPNYVWNQATQKTELGRFGWKANQPNLLQQTAGAFLGDMGITSSLFPNEPCPYNINCDTLPNGGTPEIDDENLNKVVLYSSSLAVPIQRNHTKSEVIEGKNIFKSIGCAGCHTESFTTGNHPTFTAFSEQTIYPYTDLLLHDMGNDLADNRPDYEANGNEWRTPPLWGIGLFETVNGHTHYLHDGRARNLEEAILWHGGEAEKAKSNFTKLSEQERSHVLSFLNSL